jgi:hypothetical protein
VGPVHPHWRVDAGRPVALCGDVADPCDVDDRDVREHHVDASTAVGDRRIQPVEILLLAHVALCAGDVVTDLLDGSIEFGLAPSADEAVRPS